MADISRRDALRALSVSAAAAATIASAPVWLVDDPAQAETLRAAEATMSPDAALARLVAGNRRFVKNRVRNPRRGTVRRAEIAEGQTPFASIVSCSDSRVPLELIFDQGLGDVFAVRVAGNTAVDPLVLGSVEYGGTVLNTPLIMVLGHEECGAVKAALDVAANGTVYPGDIPAVIKPILPAAQAAISLPKDQQLEHATQTNVHDQVQALSAVALLAERVAAGSLKIVGAEYHLHTGEVDLLT